MLWPELQGPGWCYPELLGLPAFSGWQAWTWAGTGGLPLEFLLKPVVISAVSILLQ